jgi:ADP-ribose pyrophosphatase YjhB (NUDIX family)
MRKRREYSSARAYGVLVHNNEVLLVQSSNPRYNPPLWWLPGGGIDFGETPTEALIREFDEETGIAIHKPVLVHADADVRTRPNGERVHTVRIIYTCEYVAGDIRHEADGTTARAQWFSKDEAMQLNLAEYARDVLAMVMN